MRNSCVSLTVGVSPPGVPGRRDGSRRAYVQRWAADPPDLENSGRARGGGCAAGPVGHDSNEKCLEPGGRPGPVLVCDTPQPPPPPPPQVLTDSGGGCRIRTVGSRPPPPRGFGGGRAQRHVFWGQATPRRSVAALGGRVHRVSDEAEEVTYDVVTASFSPWAAEWAGELSTSRKPWGSPWLMCAAWRQTTRLQPRNGGFPTDCPWGDRVRFVYAEALGR